MNRREVFKLCGQLAVGLACTQVARVLPVSDPPLTTGRFQPAAIFGTPGRVVITLKDNRYLPAIYATKLDDLTEVARQQGNTADNLARSLKVFQRKLDGAQ